MSAPLLSVSEARALIVGDIAPLGTESVSLASALGRVLAEDATARVSHPPADVSAMDGYAVRAGDVSALPQQLDVVGQSAAGHPWAGSVGNGQAVRIFTGAHLPKGADAVVIQEDTVAGDGAVVINEKPVAGRHIRPAGQDFRAGDVVLKSPRRLTARDIGLLAAMNLPRIPVFRKPRVGVLSTGDEIVMPGEAVSMGQIVSANGPGLSAFVEAHGGEAIHLGVVKDELAALRTAIGRAEPLELLVTSGGVSVGDHDLLNEALSAPDFSLAFHKIAMRPGKPLLFGRLKKLPIMGLPGNPVSAMVCAILFLGPAIDRLQGLPGAAPATQPARLGSNLKANDSREEYLRASFAQDADGVLWAQPFPKQDSGMISALARADCLIVRPAHAPEAKVGETIQVIRLN